jgi:hypothetical protein
MAGVAVTLLAVSARSASGVNDFNVEIRVGFIVGDNDLAGAYGTQYTVVAVPELAAGAAVLTGTADGQHPAETRVVLTATGALVPDARPDETPAGAADVAPGSYAVVAGVGIPNSVQCPDDLLIVFVATPLFLPPQFLPACLQSLPSVVFHSVPPLDLSDAFAPGEDVTVIAFQLPFILVHPAVYFVALVPPTSPITAPPVALLATVCIPGTDGAGRLTIPCTPL